MRESGLGYIRRTYGVPAWRGARVLCDWYPPEPARDGVITGSDDARLRVRLDGENRSRICHPTWNMTYAAAQSEPLARHNAIASAAAKPSTGSSS